MVMHSCAFSACLDLGPVRLSLAVVGCSGAILPVAGGDRKREPVAAADRERGRRRCPWVGLLDSSKELTLFLRYYYRRNTYLARTFMPKSTASSAGVDRYAPRYTQLRQQLQEVAYFSQRNRSGKKDEVWPAGLRLSSGSFQTPRPVLGMDYKDRGKTVNGKLDSETGPLYQAACQQ